MGYEQFKQRISLITDFINLVNKKALQQFVADSTKKMPSAKCANSQNYGEQHGHENATATVESDLVL
jgi:hypothetical protein